MPVPLEIDCELSIVRLHRNLLCRMDIPVRYIEVSTLEFSVLDVYSCKTLIYFLSRHIKVAGLEGSCMIICRD